MAPAVDMIIMDGESHVIDALLAEFRFNNLLGVRYQAYYSWREVAWKLVEIITQRVHCTLEIEFTFAFVFLLATEQARKWMCRGKEKKQILDRLLLNFAEMLKLSRHNYYLRLKKKEKRKKTPS